LRLRVDIRATAVYRITVGVARALHRVRVEGVEHVPREGGVLLVSNHASWFDGPLVLSVLERPVRFVVDRRLTQQPALAWYLAQMRVVLISAEDPPRQLLAGLRDVRTALSAGEIVCIYPEGRLTRDGRIGEFRAGFEHMVGGMDVPVVPVAIRGVWGSFFSYRYGKPMAHVPRRLRPHAILRFGAPLSTRTSKDEMRRRVVALAHASNKGGSGEGR